MIEEILKSFTSFAHRVLDVFPKSPFANVIDNIANIPWLGWLNWFFPVSECISLMVLWLGAIAVFYGWQIIGRWIKVLGD